MTEGIVEVFNRWLEAKMFSMHTCIPGEIVSYNGHQERKAKVQPLVNPLDYDNTEVRLQPIDDVPIIFPSGGNKQFNFLFPLSKGDGVLLLFSEAAIGNYLNGTGQETADDNTRFNLTDCMAIPGLWSFRNAPTKPDNDNDLFIEFQNASIQMASNTGEITIKNNTEEINMSGTGEISIKNSTGEINMASSGIVTINNNLEVLI